MYSFSQRTLNEWNKLSTDCVTASSVNMFKNKVYTYLRRVDYTYRESNFEKCWTFNKPMASLSTCHLGLCFGWLPCPLAIWAFALDGNLVKDAPILYCATSHRMHQEQ